MSYPLPCVFPHIICNNNFFDWEEFYGPVACLCVCVLRQLGSKGSVVITRYRYQSLPLAPGKVLPICVCVYLSSGFKGWCFNYTIPTW